MVDKPIWYRLVLPRKEETVVGRLGPKRVPWQDVVSRVESSVRRAPLTWIRVRGQEKNLLLCVFRHCATMS